jgi:glutathione synthase/RimK-type ligase-like ATP-grasp enzyme
VKKCALLTCQNLSGYVVDDSILVEPLLAKNIKPDFVAWDNPHVDWGLYDLAVVRSTWDYTEKLPAFLAALKNISLNTKLYNSLPLIEWNYNKKYLFDLQKRGAAVLPTALVTPNEVFSPKKYMKLWDSNEIILKPVVSANARNTYRISNLDFESPARLQDYIVQPFVKKIVTEGEYSLHYFNHQFSHAIQKVPKSGDFRVQEEHGGEIIAVEPTANMLKAADKVLTLLPEKTLYARVDIVSGFAAPYELMELEIIEPAMYLRTNTNAADNFANAIAESTILFSN